MELNAPMQEEFKKFITENLPRLKPVTSCNSDLMDRMKAVNILIETDAQEIVSRETDDSKASKFYSILLRKSQEAYFKTIEVLETCGQGVAANILTEGIPENYSRPHVTHKSQNKIYPNQKQGIWFQVQHPVESFTGRETEIERLHDLLTRASDSPSVMNQVSTTAGLGGVGKSELARAYALKYFEHYAGNFIWINAENQESFRISVMHLLAEHFNISEEESKNKKDKELLKVIYEHYAKINTRCLIIFDNVEDFDVIHLLPLTIVPNTNTISTLITSRLTVWKYGIEVMVLDVLSIEEATRFVKKTVNNSVNDDDIINLVNALQCLPLALQQAVAYMREELIECMDPVKKYLELYQKQTRALLNYNQEQLSPNERTTLRTWTLTMNKLKNMKFGSLATHIMSIISFFGPDNIPVKMFINQESVTSFSDKLRYFLIFTKLDIYRSEDEVNSAVGLLKRYSLISGPPGIINVHRLVQRVVQLNIGTSATKTALKVGIEMLSKYMDPATENSETVKSCLQHSESIWLHSLNFNDVVRLYCYFPSRVCEKLKYYGRYEALLQFAQNSFNKLESILGSKNHYTICIKYYEALALYMVSKSAESMKICKYILPIAQYMDYDLSLTMGVYNLSANNYEVEGKYEDALAIYEEIESKLLTEYGPHDGDTLTTINNKASALLHLGKLEDALEASTNAWKVGCRVLGNQNLTTLHSRTIIAKVLMAKECYDEALLILESVYESQKLILEETHPDTRIISQYIAICRAKTETL